MPSSSSSSSSSGDQLMADANANPDADKAPFEKPQPKVTATTLQRYKGHYKAWVRIHYINTKRSNLYMMQSSSIDFILY